MLNYNGNDGNLASEINEYNQGMRILQNGAASDRVKRRAIDNIEARLISIINTATNVDPTWLASNRSDILNAFDEFDDIRESLNFPRSPQINPQFNAVKNSMAQNPISFKTIALQCAKYGSISGGATLAAGVTVGVTATGVSALSFFGGPVVGGIVTGVVGGASAIGTVAATTVATTGGIIYGACKNPLNN